MKTAIIIVLIVASLGLAGGDLYYTTSLKSDYADTVAALTARAEGLGDRLAALETGVAGLAARPGPPPLAPPGPPRPAERWPPPPASTPPQYTPGSSARSSGLPTGGGLSVPASSTGRTA